MKYLKLTAHDKLRIIEEAKYNGVITTCQKYNISHVNYYNWLKKIESSEETALKSTKKKKDTEVFDLLKENRQLKKELLQKEHDIQKYLAIIQNIAPQEMGIKKTRLTVSY